jgi:hypothetical protein
MVLCIIHWLQAVSSLACDMLYRYLHVFIWWVSAASVLAQAPRFYIGYGIHRAEYLNSNIRIDQPVYGRTLFFRNVGAHDQPDYEAYASKDISIPQFQLKVGYRITPRLYLEASLHHLKYKIDEQVLVDLEERMEGSYTRQLVNITSVMPKYEHSDGLNMVLLSVAVPFQVQRTGKWYSDFTLLAKAGPGVPIAHSDNAIVSPTGELEYNRKRFHLAGVGLVAGPELRYQVLSHLFMSVSTKGWPCASPMRRCMAAAAHTASLGTSFRSRQAIRPRLPCAATHPSPRRCARGCWVQWENFGCLHTVALPRAVSAK